MSAPSYIGTTTFRETSRTPNTSQNGVDTMTVVRRGRWALLAAEEANFPKGVADSEEPAMYLQSRSSRSAGVFSTLTLQYAGYLGESDAEDGLINVTNSIVEQSVTLDTDAGENVDFKYYAQTTVWKWIHRGASAPLSPKYPLVVDSSIGVGNLFDPNPVTYSGAVDYKVVGRLNSFNPERLARGVWAVSEGWIQKIEANKTIT